MSEQEEIPKFFVPGLEEDLYQQFLQSILREEQIPIAHLFFRIKYNRDCCYCTAQVGMSNPHNSDDVNDCIRLILRKDDFYKVFVSSETDYLVPICNVLTAVQFTD